MIATVFAVGTLGYYLIEESTWWDAFYMTLITVTTVGFSEEIPLSEAGEVWTALVLVTGLGAFLFLVGETSRAVLEGELRRMLGRVRRSRMIDRMTGHEIVCGYGRMGIAVVEQLRRGRRTVVVVDRDPERARTAEDAGIATIVGDAASEAVLRSVNIDRAHGLVACLSNDANNVYTVLTARSMNADLLIVARAGEDGASDRILRAGADRVVNPYRIGGVRLASLVVKPTVVNFFDTARGGGDYQLDQAELRPGSPLVGRTLAEVDVRQRWGLSVVAVQRQEEVFPNPDPGFRLQPDDVLVVFGSRTQITQLSAQCEGR